MLQRIQTVYLSICALCFAFSAAMPIAKYTLGDENTYTLYTYKVLIEGASFGDINYVFKPIYVLPFILFLSIYAIFKFKNRKQQVQIVHFNYILMLLYIVAFYFALDSVDVALESISNKSVSHLAGFYLPVVGLAFNFLAARGIKKDEELVRSVDRLR